MRTRPLVPLLTILALAGTGCAAQSREETKVLLQELTFVRVALKAQREQLRKLKQQTAALAALVQRMERAQAKRAAAAPGPRLYPSDPGPGFTRVGPRHYRIARSALNRHLGDTNRLTKGVRIIPRIKNGQPAGFKLYSIKHGSIYAAIGLHNGDAVVRVNGHSISTPDKALTVYTMLRSQSKITVELERRGKTMVMRYEIVD